LNDPALKDRINGLKAIRDQAKADAERAQTMLRTPAARPLLRRWCAPSPKPRAGISALKGWLSRDHLRALAQRVEVADGEVRIMDRSPGCYRC